MAGRREHSVDKSESLLNRGRGWAVAAALAVVAAVVLAACGSSGSKSASSSASTTAPGGTPTTVAPSETFSTASVQGLGTVVVDGNGRTVYVLTADGKTNVNCDDASGCTKVWPDLPLPDGVSGAKAGMGIQSSLLGTKKLSDGETYPTYHGWLMYEFAGDGGPGQGKGQGIKSFGGTWYALTAAGDLVNSSSTAATSAPATTSSGSGSGSGTPGY